MTKIKTGYALRNGAGELWTPRGFVDPKTIDGIAYTFTLEMVNIVAKIYPDAQIRENSSVLG